VQREIHQCNIFHVAWLRQGWVLFETNVRVFSGIQFTRHFIEIVVVETKQIVSSNSNVQLTRQTCGQRSGMAAASKRWVLAFCFSVKICYTFLILKYRGESDLGRCMSSVLAKRMPLHSADFWFLNVFGCKIRRKLALRSGILFASTERVHIPRSDFPLHFDIRNIQQIRTKK